MYILYGPRHAKMCFGNGRSGLFQTSLVSHKSYLEFVETLDLTSIYTIPSKQRTTKAMIRLMELNLCQKSRHVNNGQFKSKHAILKITPV